MMVGYEVKVNGRRVDEVVFLNNMKTKQVFDALVADGYDPKTLTVKRTYIYKSMSYELT